MKTYYSLSIQLQGGSTYTIYGGLDDLRSQREAFWEDRGNNVFLFIGHTQYVDMRLVEISVEREAVQAIIITHFGD